MQALAAKEAYRLWAPLYEVENVVSTLECAAVERITPPLDGCALLDVACGTARRRPAAAAEYVGCDLVPAMLQRAPHGWLAAADMRALPLRDALFDIVWCRLALGHVPDITAAYAELARVARQGATVVTSDFHADAAAAGHQRTFRDAGGALHAVEHHVHDAAAHVAAAAAAGLELVGVREGAVDESVRGFYEAAARLDRYQQDRGLRLVVTLAFRA